MPPARVDEKAPGKALLYGGFPKLDVPFWGPYNEDYTSLGSILGYPNFGKLPYEL